MSKSVLVTGAGKGIGFAAALSLSENGWTVFAGARDPRDRRGLAEASHGKIIPVALDVTSAHDLAALDNVLPGRLDAVVNNAGTVLDGPVESLELSQLGEVFAVNTLGAIAVTQQVLPRLRAGGGRIVFISSVSGRISTPWTGGYCASKFALEALADALRIELRPWGLPVTVIEPDATDTQIWSSAHDQLEQTVTAMSEQHRELYRGHIAGIRTSIRRQQNKVVPVTKVVEVINHALVTKSPHARYVVGVTPAIALSALAIAPASLTDAVLAKAMNLPAPNSLVPGPLNQQATR